ncbi:hypothetical protein [Sutcliffiella horikoshii]|uniref:hypothetical protein n=1 Tax=Sutcliffiella horikoshii TaxID=79883 RepID=UPI001653A121|nr:hypothetical protein [Sutcliffiella horikoshii]
MRINKDLDVKIKGFSGDLSYLAELLLKEVEAGKKSNTQIEAMLREEIREIVMEDEA